MMESGDRRMELCRTKSKQDEVDPASGSNCSCHRAMFQLSEFGPSSRGQLGRVKKRNSSWTIVVEEQTKKREVGGDQEERSRRKPSREKWEETKKREM